MRKLSKQSLLIRDLLWLSSKSEVLPHWWSRTNLETATGSRRVAARISDLRQFYEIESRLSSGEAEYRWIGEKA